MPISRQALLYLVDYSVWADQQLLSACTVLTPEEQGRDLGSSHIGVSGTLRHIYDSERFWLSQFRKGELVPLTEFINPRRFPPAPPSLTCTICSKAGARCGMACIAMLKPSGKPNLRWNSMRSTGPSPAGSSCFMSSITPRSIAGRSWACCASSASNLHQRHLYRLPPFALLNVSCLRHRARPAASNYPPLCPFRGYFPSASRPKAFSGIL